MAGNRNIIKGITVEIGGDTTKLGKALEDVNKRSDDLSNELREINRQLKFDPENTELLAQKQKVLADTVETTRERLMKLKEAQRQAQEQLARNEISEAQFRALQREVIQTESKLESYEQQAKEAAEGTKKLADNARDAGEAGETMGAKLSNVAKGALGAIAAGTAAAAGALVASAEATREYRTEMGKLTTAYETVGHRTEIAEEAYKRLYGVIGETDQTVEASQQIALLAESEEDVIQWADLGAGVVARFGDALQPETFFEAANETIKLGEATGAYVQLLEGAGYDVEAFNEGLAACTTESEKQAYMLKFTDEILGDAADKYRETNAAVIEANDANAAWTATLAEAGAAVEPVLTDVKLLGASLLGELMPGITSVTDAFGGIINGEEGSAEALGTALSGLVTQIADMAVNLLPTLLDTAISLVSSLLGTVLPSIIDAVVTLIPQLVTSLIDGIPALLDGAVQLLLAIVDAIPIITVDLLSKLPDLIMALINGLLKAVPELLEGAVQFLLAIVDAIPILLNVLLPQIPRIVETVVTGLLNNLPVLIDGAVELFFGILEAIPQVLAALYEQAPSITKTLVTSLLETVPALFDAGIQLINGLIDGMLDFDFIGAVSSIGDGIVKGFKKVFDIHSPSRVMMGIGQLLDEGLAEGITEGAASPIDALDKLSTDMIEGAEGLDGVALERKVAYSYSNSAAATATSGISSKLDQIYQAILKGQVIMLDGKALVGSTADRYDSELGMRKVLAERGAF